MTNSAYLIASILAVSVSTAAAQSPPVVRHIQTAEAAIASAVWVGDMLYVSGQLPGVGGSTQAQAEATLVKIQDILKAQGLTMGDIVMMRVYLAADPAMENKLDFAGMNAAYRKFFGTAEQPNKPARSTFQVAALVAAGALIEIEVQAVRH